MLNAHRDGGLIPSRRCCAVHRVIPAVLGLACAILGSLAVSASAASRSALYYVSYRGGGYIHRVELVPPYKQAQLVKLGPDGVAGIAFAGNHMYWDTVGEPGRNLVVEARLDGSHSRKLVGSGRSPIGLVATNGFLYWIDGGFISRVALDGSHLNRRFIDLLRWGKDEASSGLATDGHYLYFSRCLAAEVGRVGVDAKHADPSFVRLAANSCPQSVAVNGTGLYWGRIGIDGDGVIGRANLDGSGVDPAWLDFGTGLVPTDLAADSDTVFWAWTVTGPSFTSYIGDASLDGSHIRDRFLAGESQQALAVGPSPISNSGGPSGCHLTGSIIFPPAYVLELPPRGAFLIKMHRRTLNRPRADGASRLQDG